MIYWTDYNQQSDYQTIEDYLTNRMLSFDRWPSKESSDCNVFDSDGSISYIEPLMSGARTSYLMAAMGGVGEFPDSVRNLFLTREKNSAGIHGVSLYIRGKPWHISLDDILLYNYDNLYYAKHSLDGKAMWGAILEKAWAKLKGNYINMNDGYVPNGMRVLTGAPVFSYAMRDLSTPDAGTTFHNLAKANDDLGYIASATVAGTDNRVLNACGL